MSAPKMEAASAILGVMGDCVFRLKKLTPEHLKRLQRIEMQLHEYGAKLEG